MIWRLGWYNAVWARASSEVINNWTWSQRPTIIYKQLQTAVSALLLVVLVHIWLYLAAAEGSDRRAKNGRENTTCTISDSIGSGRRLSSRQDDWLIWPQYLPGTETHKAYAPRHSPLVLSQQYMATIEICFTEQLKWSEDTRTRCSIVGGLCISIDCQQIFFHVKFLLPWQAVARVAGSVFSGCSCIRKVHWTPAEQGRACVYCRNGWDWLCSHVSSYNIIQTSDRALTCPCPTPLTLRSANLAKYFVWR